MIGLTEDRKFLKITTSKEIVKNNIEKILCDISTPSMRNLYSIVNEENINYKIKALDVLLKINIVDGSTGFTVENIESQYRLDSLSSMYSLYPSYVFIAALNSYICSASWFSDFLLIYLNEMIMNDSHKSIIVSEDTKPKVFKKLGLKTDTYSTMKDNVILFKNKEFFILNKDEVSDYTFKKIAVPIYYTESMSLMTYEEYCIISDIDFIILELTFLNNVVVFMQEETTLDGILMLSLSISQILKMYYNHYKKEMILGIEVKYMGRSISYNILINEKYCDMNFYDIIIYLCLNK